MFPGRQYERLLGCPTLEIKSSSVGEQQPILDNFAFQRLSTHLKPPQHRAATTNENLSFEQAFWNRQITHEIAGSLCSINAQCDEYSATLANRRSLRKAA